MKPFRGMLPEDPNYWYLLRVTGGRIDYLIVDTVVMQESTFLSIQPVCSMFMMLHMPVGN